MWVPLETPRQEEFDRKSSSPPTRSLGTETSMELGSHWTGTAYRTDFTWDLPIQRDECDVSERASGYLTLTAAFVISQRQAPWTVTIIRVVPWGASVTTASIQMFTSSNLYTDIHKTWVKWKITHTYLLFTGVLTLTALSVHFQHFTPSTLTSARTLGVDAYFCTASILLFTLIHVWHTTHTRTQLKTGG